MTKKSDGSTASYYELPKGATQLQALISAKNMNAQIGEIFRACYRYGEVEHSPCLRDAKKIKFYIEAEIARLESLELRSCGHPKSPLAECGDCTVLETITPEEPPLGMPEKTCCKHGTLLTQSCKHCQYESLVAPTPAFAYPTLYCNECKAYNCIHNRAK